MLYNFLQLSSKMFRLVLISGFVAFAYNTPQASQNIPVPGQRIVGGRTATIEQYPYQLSLEFLGSLLCGASLIKPNVAVTAAHCTRGADLYLVLGLLIIRAGTSSRASGGQVTGVTSICNHPKFNGLDYDVSVILLDKPFTLSPSVQTIPLQPRNSKVPIGTLATVTGFGRLAFNGSPSETLQVVDVPRVSQEDCLKSYPFRIKERMFCFGFIEGTKDSCQGDSGGPLVVNRKLAGIVSFGKGCALPNTPGVYTKVSNPEINDHINACIRNFLVPQGLF